MRYLLLLCFSFFITLPANAAAPDDQIATLRTDWAVLKYQTPDKDKQIDGLQALADRAAKIANENPDAAEPLIWRAAILSTKASLVGGLGALGDVTKARDAALAAEKLNPQAIDGYALTILGTLYHKVPGWPIAFGDNDKAQRYMNRAMAVNPDGLDSNFYYGEYLLDQGDKAKARQVLNHALAAPPRPGQDIADAGRKAEIEKLLAKLKD